MAGENINRRLNIYINDKEVVNSMGGVTRAIAQTKNELRGLVRGAENYESEVKRLTEQLATLSEHQNEFKDELKLTNKEMGAASENFSNLLGGLATGDMDAVQTAMLGIRGSIVATTQAAWAFVATPVGAFIAAFVGLGLAAKEVADFNESIKESNQLLDNLGVDTKIRPAIEGLVQTYKVGFEDLANAIDNMVDLGLVKNEFEALEKIKEGLVKAPDKNAFLAMLDANGVAAKNLGLQLEDIIGLNESFEDSGANAEAVFGALQKASSTLILQSPQLKKSLENSFGAPFTNDLLAKLRTGQITYYDALDQIHKKGEEIGLSNQKQAQLAKDLFGKSAIAAGGYEMILGNVSNAQGKQTQALTETQKQTKKLADSNIELAESQDRALKLDGYNRWKNNALLAINKVKTAWYTMISGLLNNEDDIKRAAQAKGEANRLKDEEANFNDYMARRQKRLGEKFDWEKEKAEHLADVVKRMNANWNTDVEQKSFDLQISVIKTSKNPNAKKSKDDGSTEDNTKASDAAAKKREKEIADVQKHSDDLLKELEKSKKDLLSAERASQDSSFNNQKESYEKELKLLNVEYDRKIEDTKLKVGELQTEIEKLNQESKDPKNTKADNAVINATIAEKIATQKQYSDILVSIEQSRNLKIGTLQEKYLEKSFQKQQENAAREVQNLKTKQNFELAEITSFEQAKGLLAKTLSSEELTKIKTLEDAKKAIKKQNLKEQYDLELKNLNDLVALYESSLKSSADNGFTFLSDEEKEKVIKFLDDAKAKIAEITGNKTDVEAAPEEGKKKTGIDILGFNSNQWEEVFTNLDAFENKIAAIQMVAGALTQVFSAYFKFLEAGEARTLQKFQKSSDAKKKHLADQLEKGAISQEVYNARIAKVDAELARKKAEIEYKQAKRQKAMAIVSAIVNTAVGIMQAYSQLGPIGGTIAAVLIGAMGALEVATIAKQPLPDKNGFKKGGYTGSGSTSGVAGDVHFEEYVIPEKVLFSNDPVVPNIVGYLEQKRQGKNPSLAKEETTTNTASTTGALAGVSEALIMQIITSLDRNSAILEKIDKEGLEAFLVNDIKTAKKIRDKIKELTKLENKAKA
jgi:uncharacterized small protein (DUF1192 family)